MFQHPPREGRSDCQQIHGSKQRHGRVQRSQCKERMNSGASWKATVGNESMEHFRLTLNCRVLYLLCFCEDNSVSNDCGNVPIPDLPLICDEIEVICFDMIFPRIAAM